MTAESVNLRRPIAGPSDAAYDLRLKFLVKLTVCISGAELNGALLCISQPFEDDLMRVEVFMVRLGLEDGQVCLLRL